MTEKGEEPMNDIPITKEEITEARLEKSEEQITNLQQAQNDIYQRLTSLGESIEEINFNGHDRRLQTLEAALDEIQKVFRQSVDKFKNLFDITQSNNEFIIKKYSRIEKATLLCSR